MKGIKLTQEQFELINGKSFASYQFFNPIKIENSNYLFLSNNDKKIISETEFSFLNNIEETDVNITYSKPIYL